MIINFNNIGSNGGGADGGVVINVDANTTINGYSAPDMTGNNVTAAYNAIVAGKHVTIADATDRFFYTVQNVDNTGSEISVTVLYHNIMILIYVLENDTVTILHYALNAGETLVMNNMSSLIGQDNISRTDFEDAGWSLVKEEKLLAGDYDKINYWDGEHVCRYPLTQLTINETNWKAEFTNIAIEEKDDGDYKIYEI